MGNAVKLWMDAYGWYLSGFLALAAVAFGCFLYGRTKELGRLPDEMKYKIPKPDDMVKSQAARRLSEAIRIKTTPEEGEEGIRAFREFLKKTYPKTHQTMKPELIGGGSLLFHWAGTDANRSPVLFCGHMDTVGAEGKWKHAPFLGEITNGHVYGRGALDCKNTIISLMETAESLIESGFTPRRDIYFAFGHDEESGGEQGAKVISEVLRKRGVRPELVLDEGSYIALDFLDHRGCTCAVVNVAEKGMTNIRLTSWDKGGHAAYPPQHTGLGLLCEAVCRIEATPMPCQLSPLTESYFEKIAPALRFKYRFLFANRFLFRRSFFRGICKNPRMKALVSNTIAATQASAANASNVMPQESTCMLNCRMLPGVSSMDVLEHITSIVHPMGIEAEMIYHIEPSEDGDGTGVMFSEVEVSIKKRFGSGIIVTPGLMAGGSDAKYYEEICKTVLRFTPVAIRARQYARMHAPDEAIPVDALGAAVEWYQEFIEKITR